MSVPIISHRFYLILSIFCSTNTNFLLKLSPVSPTIGSVSPNLALSVWCLVMFSLFIEGQSIWTLRWTARRIYRRASCTGFSSLLFHLSARLSLGYIRACGCFWAWAKVQRYISSIGAWQIFEGRNGCSSKEKRKLNNCLQNKIRPKNFKSKCTSSNHRSIPIPQFMYCGLSLSCFLKLSQNSLRLSNIATSVLRYINISDM